MLNLANHVMLQEMKTFSTGGAPPWGAVHVHVRPRVALTAFAGVFLPRGHLGSRGRGHARLLAGHGGEALGAGQETVPEDGGGAGPVPPGLPEESPVSPAGPTGGVSPRQHRSEPQARYLFQDYEGEN